MSLKQTDSVIVTDAGFAVDDWSDNCAGGFTPLADLLAEHDISTPAVITAIDLAPADDPKALLPWLDRVKLIRIAFPSFADGRGFTIARSLRRLGYTGRLRAAGHVIADQYAMARRAGFDEIEISTTLAARQPVEQWQSRANWQAHDYQSRLRA